MHVRCLALPLLFLLFLSVPHKVFTENKLHFYSDNARKPLMAHFLKPQ